MLRISTTHSSVVEPDVRISLIRRIRSRRLIEGYFTIYHTFNLEEASEIRFGIHLDGLTIRFPPCSSIPLTKQHETGRESHTTGHWYTSTGIFTLALVGEY